MSDIVNRGRGFKEIVPLPRFPNADEAVYAARHRRPADAVDILFVNPPAPDGGIWIRSQHRVGRRSREGMIWPQVSLAQLAALFPDYKVALIDAIPTRMSWADFEAELERLRPRFYITQVTAPTLRNDMYGAFLARSLGAKTIAFGTHVTPVPLETMDAFPSLDYILIGEPELTLRELVDFSQREEGGESPAMAPAFRARLDRLFRDSDPTWNGTATSIEQIKGLVWRRGSEVVINAPRPYIRHLDDLPIPRHELLPLRHYRAPLVKGSYAFVVTSRGCPAGCRFCIKHVSYGQSVRFRSPENVLEELEYLVSLGVHSVHMYADLFTVSREQVMGICEGILERGLKLRWTCNSRVDFVDPEMLRLMHRAGCWMISWGIESGNREILRRVRKGITPEQVERALRWSREAGISNWGYFIIGLPGETEETIQETIRFAKKLPLDLALFHIAAPHPGTPFFFEVVENGWFRPGTQWEQVDMDRSTVLDYPHLPAERLEYWARVAFRSWAFRPHPMLTYLKMMLSSPSMWGTALRIGWESLGWMAGGS